MDFTEEIERGVALLNERLPDWPKHIDTNALDLWNPNRCVLGQVAPELSGTTDAGYHRAMFLLELKFYEAAHYGFDLNGWGNYDQLTDQWRTKVRRLQTA